MDGLLLLTVVNKPPIQRLNNNSKGKQILSDKELRNKVLTKCWKGNYKIPNLKETDYDRFHVFSHFHLLEESNDKILFLINRKGIKKIKAFNKFNLGLTHLIDSDIQTTNVMRLSDYYQWDAKILSYNASGNKGIGDERPGVSISTVWRDPKYEGSLKIVIDRAIEKYRIRWNYPEGNINIHGVLFRKRLLESIYSSRLLVSHYPPTHMISLINILRKVTTINNVFDPFSGWGDRLIAAMSINVNYTATEVNRGLMEGYANIMEDFDPKRRVELTNNLVTNGKHTINMVPFEDYSDDKKYDCVVTSPPYWNVEIYQDDNPDQSTSRAESYNNWMKLFLRWLSKSFNMLRKGGFMIYQVNDSRVAIIDRMLDSMSKIKDAVYMGNIPIVKYTYINNNFIWKRS